MVITTNLLGQYVQFVQGFITAILPLLAATIGVFVAFAIANLVRHLIQRIAK